VLRWMWKAPRDPKPAQRWLAFLSNHREAIAAMDFFTVPTLTFGVLYCFFVIAHDRRRILHRSVTKHPTTARLWRCQGWAVCIIATNWPPDMLLGTSFLKVEDERQERCACRSLDR